MKELYKALADIQQRLKVPKDQDNKFADFKYRNLEDIEDKVKPLLKEHNLVLTFEDEMVEVGGRVYCKATAVLTDGESEIRKSAFAREAVTPKAKTDDAQLTGAVSSYARKYAASGLFLIDNTKDADSQDNSVPAKSTPVIRNRPEEAKAGAEPMDEDTGTELDRAKVIINKELIKHDYTLPDQKQAFITMVIEKPTIDNIDDANAVMDAIEAEGDDGINQDGSYNK